jgi:hypothetical protein
MHGVICAGVILSVMGAAFFFYVLCAPHPWPVCLVCAGTDWLVPKSPVAFHTLGLGLLPVCITPSTSASNLFYAILPSATVVIIVFPWIEVATVASEMDRKEWRPTCISAVSTQLTKCCGIGELPNLLTQPTHYALPVHATNFLVDLAASNSVVCVCSGWLKRWLSASVIAIFASTMLVMILVDRLCGSGSPSPTL